MSDWPPPKLRLSLLGSFALSGPDGPVELSSKKLVDLVAYLALTATAPQPRDKLLTLLWGSHFDVQATSGRTASIEEAKSQFLVNWQKVSC